MYSRTTAIVAALFLSVTSAAACSRLEGGELLEEITVNYYIGDRESARFSFLFVPARRVMGLNGVRSSTDVLRVIELTRINGKQQEEVLGTVEFVDNKASGASSGEVTVLVLTGAESYYLVGDRCGNVVNSIR